MAKVKLDKSKLGLLTAGIAEFIFIIGIPLRQIEGSLNFLSGLHGNTAQATGLTLQGIVIGSIMVFVVYFSVGWLAGYIYEKIA